MKAVRELIRKEIERLRTGDQKEIHLTITNKADPYTTVMVSIWLEGGKPKFAVSNPIHSDQYKAYDELRSMLDMPE